MIAETIPKPMPMRSSLRSPKSTSKARPASITVIAIKYRGVGLFLCISQLINMTIAGKVKNITMAKPVPMYLLEKK